MTKNQTELSAECWVDKVIREYGKTKALQLIRYNLSGKNPYWGNNPVFDTAVASYVNNVINPS